jgi:asparagine synthase (glutamine-hydrolysing)
MCGISGVVSRNLNSFARESKIQIMNRAMQHRGPDDESFRSVSRDCSLGMVRLKVIDFEGGQQPFSADCKQASSLHLVFNGEIYNHNELRKVLITKGHSFKSINSDTEVILHAYEEWGTESFEKLNGMFAFAIFDALFDELIIVRDRFGEKPLYYQHENEIFKFCSEIKGLYLIGEKNKKLDEDAFLDYLILGFIGSARTAFQNINKLPAGHFLVLSKDNKISVKRYFSFVFTERYKSNSELHLEFNNLMEKSVKDRMIADVPVGVFLSGGLDSSTVAYYAKKMNPNVNSFSIGFSESAFNEAQDAKLVADYLKINHKSRIITQNDAINFLSILPNVLDEPMADVSIIPTYYLAELASEYVTVALGGDGSDEFSYGYEVFNILIKLNRLRYLKSMINPISNFANIFPLKPNLLKNFYKAKLLLNISNPQLLTNILTAYNYPYIGQLIDQKVYKLLSGRFFEDSFPKTEIKLEKQWILGYMNGYLSEDILVKIDRASMASSLEVRSPFLDHDLVDFFLRVPMENNYSKGIGKQLIRKSMKGKLPDSTLNKKKQGFGIPVDEWFSGEFGRKCKEIILDSNLTFPGLSKNAILSLFNEHDFKHEHLRHGNILWTLTVLHLWGQKWL